MITSNKKRVRIDYAPLTVAVSVSCLTPASPAMQVYNASLPSGEQYEPDRELTPSQFRPLVYAQAPDGSWGGSLANASLAQMHWYVNGKEISTLPAWEGLYSVDTSSSASRGTLTVSRNVPPGERAALHFEALLADVRLGTNIRVITDPVTLSTEDASEDTYQVSIGESQAIRYNPFADKLLFYKYRVAQGLEEASESAEAEATDISAHIRRIPVTVFRGGAAMTSGYALHLYRVEGTVQTELHGGEGEVVEIGSGSVTLDLRLVESATYVLKAVIDGSGRVPPQICFSAVRDCPAFDCRPTNGTGINAGDEYRLDTAQVSSGGRIIENPSAVAEITWCTDTAAKTRRTHGEGEKVKFALADTGIGETYEDDWMDVYTECEARPVYKTAVSEDGDTFTDEEGNNLIFN